MKAKSSIKFSPTIHLLIALILNLALSQAKDMLIKDIRS